MSLGYLKSVLGLFALFSFGELFAERVPHHLMVVWLCLLFSLSMLVWIVVSSIKQVNKKMEEIHNEPFE